MRELLRLLALIIVWPACVLAQEQAAPPLEEAVGAAAPTTEAKRFSQQELDRLLAPIALYPDALLAQVLMASTYPLEVVEANRWVEAHTDLMGDQRQAALEEQDWDPSVKGLVMVPQVLSMMDEKLDWTEKLGDAFLAQQQDVMDTVQRLRAKAQAAGNLSSTVQQTVVTERSTVSIQPANPEVIYVPVYNPAVIYGPWWWPAPPYYWYPPGYAASGAVVYFGVGWVVGASIWGYCDWGHRTVIVNVPDYNTFNRARISDPHWTHDVHHRRGVPYRDDAVRRQYRADLPGVDARREFRGYETPRRFPQQPRFSDRQFRQDLARPGLRPPPTPGDAQPPGVPRAAPVPHAPPAVRPVPGVGDRLPAAPLPQRQPPGVGQPAPLGHLPQRHPPGFAQPVPLGALPQRQPPGVGQPAPHAPHAPPAGHQPPSVGQRFPAAPLGTRPPRGAIQRVPPAFETFDRGSAARSYSDRGAASLGTQTYRPAPGAQGAPPPGGGAQGSRPQGGARPPGGGTPGSRPQGGARPPAR